MCKLDTEKSDSMLSWSSGHWEAAGPVLNLDSEIELRELQKKFDYKDILLWYHIFSHDFLLWQNISNTVYHFNHF